jgi:hypothetical protein
MDRIDTCKPFCMDQHKPYIPSRIYENIPDIPRYNYNTLNKHTRHKPDTNNIYQTYRPCSIDWLLIMFFMILSYMLYHLI